MCHGTKIIRNFVAEIFGFMPHTTVCGATSILISVKECEERKDVGIRQKKKLNT